MSKFNRRKLLRGLMGGGVVGVALPFLDCFLDGNGQALAATGQRIPVRFGTWVWGCGITASRWVPTAVGSDYTMPTDLEPLAPYKEKIALFSGFDVKLDGVPNKPHVTGNLALRSGIPVPNDDVAAPTLDVLIGDQIAAGTRFRSIETSSCGLSRSYSFRGAGAPNPAEISPVALYQRIFGEGFQDPNAATFTPDPNTMVRESVLSAIADDRRALLQSVGANDRQRLEEYFTSIRQLEQQLALQLEPPAPVENFVMPTSPHEATVDADIDNVMVNHKLMAKLLASALACNQTRVFNMLFSDTGSNLRRAGSTTTHHTLTHEEPVSPQLGYQEQSAWFATKSMVALGDFIAEIENIREGDGTLLDNTLVFAHSDCSDAKAHAVEGIPMVVAGKAGGRIRTGFHLAGRGDPVSRVGLTVQQAMGVQAAEWGTRSMQTNRSVTELLA